MLLPQARRVCANPYQGRRYPTLLIAAREDGFGKRDFAQTILPGRNPGCSPTTTHHVVETCNRGAQCVGPAFSMSRGKGGCAGYERRTRVPLRELVWTAPRPEPQPLTTLRIPFQCATPAVDRELEPVLTACAHL